MDLRKHTKENYIEDAVIKTIAAFLNTDGGHLLVGIADDGTLTGIQNEVELLFKNRDKFLLHLKNLLKSKIGEQFYPYIDQRIVDVSGKDILVVACDESASEVFVDQKDFYVRTNPATDRLEGRRLIEYINNHFKKKPPAQG